MNFTDMVLPMKLWGGPFDGESRYVMAGHSFAAQWLGETHLYIPWCYGFMKWVAQ